MRLAAGDVLLLNSARIAGFAQHPYVVVSDPARDGDPIALVNFTGYDANLPARPRNDPTCIVQAAEYERLTKLSCINYDEALVRPASVLEEGLRRKVIAQLPAVSPELLTRIRAGVALSCFAAEKIRSLLSDQLLI